MSPRSHGWERKGGAEMLRKGSVTRSKRWRGYITAKAKGSADCGPQTAQLARGDLFGGRTGVSPIAALSPRSTARPTGRSWHPYSAGAAPEHHRFSAGPRDGCGGPTRLARQRFAHLTQTPQRHDEFLARRAELGRLAPEPLRLFSGCSKVTADHDPVEGWGDRHIRSPLPLLGALVPLHHQPDSGADEGRAHDPST